MRQGVTHALTKWRELVSEVNQSGQNVAAFCNERGLRTWQFYEWKKPVAGVRSVSIGLYIEEGLVVPRRKRKRLVREPAAEPRLMRANQEWAMDFIDGLHRGRTGKRAHGAHSHRG